MRLFRRRKHPIKRDEDGRSVRQRAFDLFSDGCRPAQVFRTLPISLRTACRYFEDFKKLHNRVPYSAIRKWMKDHPEFKESVIDMLAISLEMSREEVISRLSKPYGLMVAMKGAWPNYKLSRQRTEIEERLLAALTIVQFANIFGHKEPRLVMDTLKRLIMDRSEESSGAQDDYKWVKDG